MSNKKTTLSYEIRAELQAADTAIALTLKAITGDSTLLIGKIDSSDPFKLKDLVNAINPILGNSVPDDITIKLDQLLLIFRQAQNETQYLVSFNFGASINLSNLPLIGQEFSETQTFAIENFNLLFTSAAFSKLEKIPELPQTELSDGLNLVATMRLGDKVETLAIASSQVAQSKKLASKSSNSVANSSETIQPQLAPQAATSSEAIKWFDLKKNVGSVYFKRIGGQYQNSEICLLLDASITMMGLMLTLDGLSVSSSITKFKPKFNLRGLGIQYESKGSFSIAGALLRTIVDGKDDYSGAVLVRTKAFTLSAIASYTTTTEGHPSLLIYGTLDKPLGGPPCFFVTGLALGFAYNRTLILPSLDEIPQFPLVRAALNGSKTNVGELMQIQRDLRPYTPPKTGQFMLAIGVKFTSFKIVESFVLLVASFGHQFSLDLLGISTLISPPVRPANIPPLAQIHLAILARFVPDEGTLKINGKILPDSFLFERDCRISGGFAFYSWFKGDYQDDFVLTIGGYHPKFKPPEHYPKVDPLSLNWQLNGELSLKGKVYFALTASAIMAGGQLEAVWQSNNARAWFIAQAHFILAWQPYAYDARISLNVGASYTFTVLGIRKTVSYDLGADLHIWGPKFSGTATLDLKVTSLTIAFGNRSQNKPPPLTWQEFKQSFLPEQVCAVAVESGLLRKLGEGATEVFIVDPQAFVLSTSSVIPIKTLTLNSDSDPKPNSAVGNSAVGIAPMQITHTGFSKSHYKISIKSQGLDVSNLFELATSTTKNVPEALWSASNSFDLNKRFIEDVLCGYTIKPNKPPTPGQTASIDLKNLAYDLELKQEPYQWTSFHSFQKDSKDDEKARENNIVDRIQKTTQSRQTLLGAIFGTSDLELDLDDFTPSKIKQAFVIAPQIQRQP